MLKFSLFVFALLAATQATLAGEWFVSYSGRNNSLVQIGYGTPNDQPQYAALDLTSCYLRMVYGPTSGWGTSIITMPSYWSRGVYHQGCPVVESHQTIGDNLVLTLHGTSTSLSIAETITFLPPTNNEIRATVQANVTGTVQLDNRAGEAFKPVMLSSMHDSGTVWDASAPFVDTTVYSFPGGGWIIAPNPPVTGTQFGLLGGTSQWKTNAPTVTVALSGPMQIAGWLNADNNPNDDNVGFWPATSTVMSSWIYEIIANNATVPTQVVHADAFSVPRGSLLYGGLGDLQYSDDSRVAFRAGNIPFATDFPVQVVITGTSPVANPSDLKVVLETEAQFTNIGQTIELFDYTANAYVQVDFRQASTTDQVVEVGASNPSRFVEAGSRHIQARIKYRAIAGVPILGWTIGIDQAIWEITP